MWNVILAMIPEGGGGGGEREMDLESARDRYLQGDQVRQISNNAIFRLEIFVNVLYDLSDCLIVK